MSAMVAQIRNIPAKADGGRPPLSYLPNFGTLLKQLRMEKAKDQASLARMAGVNSAYISRLENDIRRPPSRDVVFALANGLSLDGEERDRFFASAGLLPPSGVMPEKQDRLLNEIVGLLYDESVPFESREEFRAVMRSNVRRWRLSLAMERIVRSGAASRVD